MHSGVWHLQHCLKCPGTFTSDYPNGKVECRISLQNAEVPEDKGRWCLGRIVFDTDFLTAPKILSRRIEDWEGAVWSFSHSSVWTSHLRDYNLYCTTSYFLSSWRVRGSGRRKICWLVSTAHQLALYSVTHKIREDISLVRESQRRGGKFFFLCLKTVADVCGNKKAIILVLPWEFPAGNLDKLKVYLTEINTVDK